VWRRVLDAEEVESGFGVLESEVRGIWFSRDCVK
jgi:hypothetical protein